MFLIKQHNLLDNPKPSFIINAVIHNTKKVIYMNRQTDKEMPVYFDNGNGNIWLYTFCPELCDYLWFKHEER